MQHEAAVAGIYCGFWHSKGASAAYRRETSVRQMQEILPACIGSLNLSDRALAVAY